ncbi:MAG TPA: M64 family metallopeptidase, partial [Terriglobia bacterium]|nr:M64 family metallopeptidase [Terriglobia bacterium]
PTPWGQERYDSLNVALSQIYKNQSSRTDELKKAGASEQDIVAARDEYSRAAQRVQKELRDFMMNNPMRGKVGAFRGAGYSAEGLYRPTINSLMNQFNEQDKSYYSVNEDALIRMIDFYSK